MSELREQVFREICTYTGEYPDGAERLTSRILALFHKPDPQDCPTCRALIEATMRVLDKPEPEPEGVAAQYPCGHRVLFGKSEDVDTVCPYGCGQTVAFLVPLYPRHTPGGTNE